MSRRARAEAIAADWIGELNPARLADALVDFADAEVEPLRAALERISRIADHEAPVAREVAEIALRTAMEGR